MKLAILGTRGIPNFYGGFEQFAQHLSEAFVKKGHQVYVYNSHTHPYQESEWRGVKIIHCKDPENKIGRPRQLYIGEKDRKFKIEEQRDKKSIFKRLWFK